MLQHGRGSTERAKWELNPICNSLHAIRVGEFIDIRLKTSKKDLAADGQQNWYSEVHENPVGVVATLGIIATGAKVAFLIGLILLIMVIISIGAQMAVATIVTERKEQTLPFVMSLPISYREYTASKIWGNLIIFLVPWVTMVLSSFGLLLWSPSSRGLLPYTAIMSTEILLSTYLILAVALITESQGWTVAAIMVGNLAVNGLGMSSPTSAASRRECGVPRFNGAGQPRRCCWRNSPQSFCCWGLLLLLSWLVVRYFSLKMRLIPLF